MENLKRAISSLNPKESDPKQHRDIFTLIEKTIPYKSPPLTTQYPPFPALIYAIRNILYPTFAWLLTSDMLNLLAVVELIRRVAVKHAKDSFVWQEYYCDPAKPGEDGVIGLTPSELRDIAAHANDKTDGENRALYRHIIQDCCFLHVYHLLYTEDRDESRSLIRRMHEYFPSLYGSVSTPPHNFHRNLSKSEEDEFHVSGMNCAKFIKQAGAWEARREAVWEEKRLPMDEFYSDTEFFSFERDFIAAFPSPVDESQFIADLERYLSNIETMVRDLETIFGSG